jgi:hypothetical protein
VPVPHREVAVVLDQPRDGVYLLLRLPEERRRDHVRPRARAPRLRRSRRAARRARRDHAPLRRRSFSRTASASTRCTTPSPRRSTSTTLCSSSLPTRARARATLRSRGFDGDVARKFSLGWSPDGYDAISRHLQQKKFSRDDIVDAGLAFVNRANKLQIRFEAA